MRETQVPMAGISDAKTNPPGCYDFVIAQLCHSNQHNAYADDKALVINPPLATSPLGIGYLIESIAWVAAAQ
jgi:hypothetical protein